MTDSRLTQPPDSRDADICDLRARVAAAQAAIADSERRIAAAEMCAAAAERRAVAAEAVVTSVRLPLKSPSGPADLSMEHAGQLQAWLPPGGSSSPSDWKEVYRGTRDGFGAVDFHAKCDGRTRLLVLVQAREGDWLFGGFTAVGFSPPQRFIADPAAFLFSLTNSLGYPEKLESKRTGEDLYYSSSLCAAFAPDLCIRSNAHRVANSHTETGHAYAESASTGDHPMARGGQGGWRAAEVVAWVV